MANKEKGGMTLTRFYDPETDTLFVDRRAARSIASPGRNPGTYIHRDVVNGEVVGVTILGYQERRTKRILQQTTCKQ